MFAQNPMGATLMAGSDLVLKDELRIDKSGYQYRLSKDSSGAWYEVSRGSVKLRAPIEWVFGTGRTGRTFVFSHENALYESRVSYYPRISGLDLTIGAANREPSDIIEAAGRLMSRADISECFGCHSSSTAGAKGGLPGSLIKGVQCERCHGNSDHHPGKRSMLSLKTASTEEISTLCGECHRTWEQVKLLNLRGVATVRFQPYRLSQSKCYDLTDRRIACTSCHDPHQAQVISQSRIDNACRSCHAGAKASCPKGKSGCASCHMPKYELPGAHAAFADHRIRIVRDKEVFPD